jgi:hypothetical protein
MSNLPGLPPPPPPPPPPLPPPWSAVGGYDLLFACQILRGKDSVYALSLNSLSEEWAHLKHQVFDSFVASFQDQDVHECRDMVKCSSQAMSILETFLAVKDFCHLHQTFQECCTIFTTCQYWTTISDCNKVYTLFEKKINVAFDKVGYKFC